VGEHGLYVTTYSYAKGFILVWRASTICTTLVAAASSGNEVNPPLSSDQMVVVMFGQEVLHMFSEVTQ
jgi:hypothetical protein